MSAVMNSAASASKSVEASDSVARGGLSTGDPMQSEAAKLTALQRIEASRTQLRNAMVATVRPPKPTSSTSGTTVKGTIEFLRHLPGAGLVVETVLAWWAKHPLHDASVIAREASGAIFRPLARENPMKLVFGALVVGALLVILKPWRFILRSAIFAGLIPQFAAMALRRLPLKTWLAMFARRSKVARPREVESDRSQSVQRRAA